MIDGMTILSQTEVTTVHYNILACLIIGLIVGVAITFLVYRGFDDDSLLFSILFALIPSLICGLIGGIILSSCEPTGQYEYKVLFDDSVTIQEIYENYNVVGQDGEIWIITDK